MATIQDVARVAGVAASTVSRYLNGQLKVTPATEARLLDAVASLGAFEHFCSPEDHAAGRQEEIYRDLFAQIADLLPPGGRLYLQTMVYGRNMIPVEQVDIEGVEGAPERDARRRLPGVGWRPVQASRSPRLAGP